MKKWFLFYSSDYKKLQQAVEEIKFPKTLAFVPWGHHIQIITKCKSAEEAAFYIKKIATEGWSRNTLINYIESDYYGKSGDAISNFDTQLPSVQSKLAQAITKETYDLGFINLVKRYCDNNRILPKLKDLSSIDICDFRHTSSRTLTDVLPTLTDPTIIGKKLASEKLKHYFLTNYRMK